MAHRKEVFRSKVLQKLYSAVPKREKEPSPPRIVETLADKPAVKRKAFQGTDIGDGGIAPCATHLGRRMYTALPPPTEYKTGAAEGPVALPRPESINTTRDPADENTNESSEDEQPDQDGEVEERRRRRRRKKRKQLTVQEHSVTDGKGQASTSSRTDVPSAGQSQTATDEGGERLSKNKRRKLKKKRHKEKLLSLGLVPRAAALEFTYQRKGEEEEDEDEKEMMKERRAAEVSDFLRTTMETYMSDSSLPADRPALPSRAVEELLSSVANGGAPPSVLTQLHSLMTLVQHKETDTLAKALEELHNTPLLSPEETTAVVSLFRYWITEVLPMQRDAKTGRCTTRPQDCQAD